jgi:hypothetical protein
MKRPSLSNTFQENCVIFNAELRTIKKRIPKSCTFMSLIKTSEGEHLLKAMIKGDEYRYTLPQDLDMTQADYDRIENLITEKCHE